MLTLRQNGRALPTKAGLDSGNPSRLSFQESLGSLEGGYLDTDDQLTHLDVKDYPS